jgi:carbamate kinase
MSKLAVIAVGGNSLIQDKRKVSVQDQYAACLETAQSIVSLIKEGYRVVITHGNGPQVGFVLRRCEISKYELPVIPLDACVSDTQGEIGYLLQKAFTNVLKQEGIKKTVVTVVTQVLVDENDTAFNNPIKPIGTFLKEADARLHEKRDGWKVIEDSGRGYRRVVASPIPIEIVEIEAIRTLVNSGIITIAVGGGGIPVVKNADGTIRGVEAVIDKDYASGLLARELNADCFVISTSVDRVSLNYGKPDQREVDVITVKEAEELLKQGQFPAGSMLPKIKALIEFAKETKNTAIITSPKKIFSAVKNQDGTRIIL